MKYIYKNGTSIGPGCAGYNVIKYLNIQRAITHRCVDDIPEDSVIINWGNSREPPDNIKDKFYSNIILNRPSAVRNSVDKRLMYRKLTSSGIKTLSFVDGASTDEELKLFAKDPEATVVRHLVSSHSGNGIEIVPPNELLPPALLYTKFVPSTFEWRLFVVGEVVVDVLQKKKMTTTKLSEKGIEFNPYIRSSKNGWVYSRNNIVNPSIQAKYSAIDAIACMGLDFGCVDIIFSNNGEYIVIETNTSPGLENPTTIINFCNALNNYINEITTGNN